MDNPFFSVLTQAIDFLLIVLPVVLPAFIIWRIILNYIDYARQKYWNSLEYVLLEIVPPGDVRKSPAAMELFLVSLHQTSGESTWIKKYLNGQTRAWFSLEIVSLGGKIHFYIWMQTKFRRFVESQLYAQYPGIETIESEDYAQIFEYDHHHTDLWGVEFALTQPDPYPIKTYIDYALDVQDKEELQVDPITPMLELLSSLNPGENMCFQYIIRAHKKEDNDPHTWFGKKDNWQDDAQAEIEKIRLESVSKIDDDSGNKAVATNQTEGQRKRIAALEKSVSKLSFDVGIRAIYIASIDDFDAINRSVVSASMKQFNSNDLNGFEVGHVTDFDYPWEDFTGHALNHLKHEILEQYKDRRYFFTTIPGHFGIGHMNDHSRHHMVLNTEELATVFHFPGKVSQAPMMQRVESRKVGPPPNLPM